MIANFYIDKKFNKNRRGESPISIFISFQGKRIKIYTGERIKPEKWDIEKQRPKSPEPGTSEDLLSELLDSYEEEVNKLRREAKIQRIDITEEYIRENLSFVHQVSKDFFPMLEKFVKQQSTLKSWSAGSVRRWNILTRKLKEFNKKMTFDDVSDSLVQKFIEWSMSRGHQNSFIAKNLQMLIQFMKWADKNDYHHNKKYTKIDYTLKQISQDDNILFLTVEEVVRLHNLKFRKDQTGLEQARDCYLFQCFTSLRYSDLVRVQRKYIKNGFLKMTSQKTGRKLEIPLLPVTLSILDKYKDLPDVAPLPVISQQKFNDHLKVLGKMIELFDLVTLVSYRGEERIEETFQKWEKLSTHTGRKTFITLGVYLGMTVEEVASISGHKSDAIKRYYTIQDAQKTASIQKLNTILKVV